VAGRLDEDRFGDYAEDYDLVMRVAERWAVGRVHDVLYRCRLHGSNTEDTRSPRFRAERKSLARMIPLQPRELRNWPTTVA
jgi:GT2 family glycosyltransferase